jgi:hypothetical protein
MYAFLQSYREKTRTFASALCGGLVIVSLALASPAVFSS